MPFVLFAILLLPRVALATLRLDGPVFQVSTSGQVLPWATASVARAPDGSFVVAWTNTGHDGNSSGVSAQRFDAFGAPIGSELLVNDYTTGPQTLSNAVGLTDGTFVVIWSGASPQDYFGVAGRRLGSDGTPLTSEFQVNGYTTYGQYDPAAAAHPDGGFLVTWAGYGSMSESSHIWGRLFEADGVPAGPEFRVSTDGSWYKYAPAVSTDDTGRFVVAWQDDYDTSSSLYVQRFDPHGNKLGTELANFAGPSFQFNPAVSSRPDGGFVVAYNGLDEYSYRDTIDTVHFGSDGQSQGGWRLSEPGAHPSSIARDGDNGFVVAWSSYYYDSAVLAQELDAVGDPVGMPLQVNDSASEYPAATSVAGHRDDGYVVVWVSSPVGGGDPGVFGRLVCRDSDDDSVCNRDDACGGFDDLTDADADDVADGCDPCSVLENGQRITVKPRITLQKLSTPGGDDRLTAGGEFVLPAGKSFDDLNPAATGARLSLVKPDGAVAADVTLPPGLFNGTSGWRVNAKGTTYSFVDKRKPPPHNGISNLAVQDRSHKVPGGIRVRVKGKNGSYSILPGETPVQLAVAAGDPVAGECGETVFGPGNCAFSAGGDKLTCR